jgi:hypothetical protein
MANEQDWRQQLHHLGLNRNLNVKWSKKKLVWAAKVTVIMKDIVTAKTEMEDQAFIDYINNAMLAIYDLTPPGSRQYMMNDHN